VHVKASQNNLRKLASTLAILFILMLISTRVLRAQPGNPKENGPVYIILWFDTEDYVLPQSDDSAKRIAEFLTSQGIRATFKVVGEKARTLERRHREDVIGALEKHAIGYHSNYHSWRVSPAEYEAALDWQDGVQEFIRREQPGIDDIRRIFGRMPTAYGQPGNSWCPEAQPALRKMGIHVYLDDGEQIGLDGRPFWYGGILNIFNMKYIGELRPNADWTNLPEVKANFKKAYTALSDSGGGLISIYFHPCEFIHKEFWDAVNFSHGAEPPRSEWKLPPVKTPEEQARTFSFFEQFVKYMKTFPVQFVTASEAFQLYPDNAQRRAFSKQDLAEIAHKVQTAVSFQVYRDYALSASEILLLLNDYVDREIKHQPDAFIELRGTPLGPSTDASDPGLKGEVKVPWYQFQWAAEDVESALEKNQQVPTEVWIGGNPYPPASYLVALARVAETLLDGKQAPREVALGPAALDAAKYVAGNSANVWDWPIFRPGFDGKHLLDLARLQAWTLKPAQLEAAHRAAVAASLRSK
jgi:peptidoglycan/xylan/chitin deacetylase (PgdA/CDA1 family)